MQKRIWERFQPGEGAERLRAVITNLEREDSRFHVEGGSWTNDISWVRGYTDVLLLGLDEDRDTTERVLLFPSLIRRTRPLLSRYTRSVVSPGR